MIDQRFSASSKFLIGHGIEVGAGPNPQSVPDDVRVTHFDIRNQDELNTYFGETFARAPLPMSQAREYFPEGADFLIAHHVLEHSADPIGTLRQWVQLVKSGGVFVLSLPHYLLCPDKDRRPPELEHLILDHVLGRAEDSAESREHILSFLCSWIDDSPGLRGLSASQACSVMLSEVRRSGHDLHWHAFDPQLTYELICVTAALAHCEVVFHLDPRSWSGKSIDILAIFELKPTSSAILVNPMASRIQNLQLQLQSAADALI